MGVSNIITAKKELGDLKISGLPVELKLWWKVLPYICHALVPICKVLLLFYSIMPMQSNLPSYILETTFVCTSNRFPDFSLNKKFHGFIFKVIHFITLNVCIITLD